MTPVTTDAERSTAPMAKLTRPETGQSYAGIGQPTSRPCLDESSEGRLRPAYPSRRARIPAIAVTIAIAPAT